MNVRLDVRSRNHPAYWAFVVHRVSGVLLVFFLPVHFFALGQALQGEAQFDSYLRWTEYPLVKAAEFGIVFLLAAHMSGGTRLLMLEFLAWRDWQQSLLAIAAGITVAFGLAFLFNLV
jgi:fumarate reductase subunit D